MNTLHLNESFPESEKLIASTTVNSNQDLANWLKAEHISPASITRFSVSFLAKIPENTSVQLLEKDGKMLIKVGESSLKIADTIESWYAQSHFVTKNFGQKLLGIVDRKALQTGHKTELPAPKKIEALTA